MPRRSAAWKHDPLPLLISLRDCRLSFRDLPAVESRGIRWSFETFCADLFPGPGVGVAESAVRAAPPIAASPPMSFGHWSARLASSHVLPVTWHLTVGTPRRRSGRGSPVTHRTTPLISAALLISLAVACQSAPESKEGGGESKAQQDARQEKTSREVEPLEGPPGDGGGRGALRGVPGAARHPLGRGRDRWRVLLEGFQDEGCRVVGGGEGLSTLFRKREGGGAGRVGLQDRPALSERSAAMGPSAWGWRAIWRRRGEMRCQR